MGNENFVSLNLLSSKISWIKKCELNSHFSNFRPSRSYISLSIKIWFIWFSSIFLWLYNCKIRSVCTLPGTIHITFRREHHETALHHSSLSLNWIQRLHTNAHLGLTPWTLWRDGVYILASSKLIFAPDVYIPPYLSPCPLWEITHIYLGSPTMAK